MQPVAIGQLIRHTILATSLAFMLQLIGCASQPAPQALAASSTANHASPQTTTTKHATHDNRSDANREGDGDDVYDNSRFASDLTMIARRASTPMKMDGKLDEPVWQSATAYPLHGMIKSNVPNFPLQESGDIRLAWDDEYLYVAGDFQDVDVVDNAKGNQRFLYSTSDAMELFLKPDSGRYYWEFYGTPLGHKSTMFYPSRGRFGLSPWIYLPDSGFKVGADYHGTPSNYTDRDKGYIIEMAVPRKLLLSQGQGLAAPNVQWYILVTRYNHSAYSETFQSELSSTPKLKFPNFHIYEAWAKLKLEQ